MKKYALQVLNNGGLPMMTACIHRSLLVFAFCCLTSAMQAQNAVPHIDQVMQSYNQLHKFDGVVLVAKKGVVVFKKGYGLANRDWNIANNTDTKFRIASVTKQFTAVIIMQLKQEGKLRLKDPITAYLPWYRKDIGSKITIYDLLTQSSGIKEYTERADYISDITCHYYAPIDFIKKFCSDDSLNFTPGTRFLYSNSNYYILGAIIEAITHQSFEQVLKKRILSVANLSHTGVDEPGTIVANKATGYDYEFGKYVNSDYININSACFASGNLYSTVGDLLLWNTALRNHTFLSKANTDTLLMPRYDGYAMGLHLNKISIPGLNKELTFIGHNGNITGFNANMIYSPELEETFILLRNEGLQSFKVDLNTIIITLFNIVNGLPYEMPKSSIVAALADKIVNNNLGAGLAYFKNIRGAQKEKFDLSTEEADINTLGYYLWGHNRLQDALAVFKLNTEEFPQSGNVFDSYGEALLQNGQKTEAINMYRKSLALNPQNENARKVLLQLSR